MGVLYYADWSVRWVTATTGVAAKRRLFRGTEGLGMGKWAFFFKNCLQSCAVSW